MHVGFFLGEGFALLPYVLGRDILDHANRCARAEVFTQVTLSLAGAKVIAGDGTEIVTSPVATHAGAPFDAVFLFTATGPQPYLPMAMRGLLHTVAQRGGMLGAAGPAASILTDMGLLPRTRLPAPGSATARASDPVQARLIASADIGFGTALLDWIAQEMSAPLAAETARALGLPHRPQDVRSQVAPCADPILAQMDSIMRANLADPVSLEEIAKRLGLSLKQMRTRCKRLRGRTPAQVYLTHRLDRARHLLDHTGHSVAEVARATGFAAPSAFTRSFRQQFNQTPRARRAQA